ncbi:MAG: nucleotidyltransferase domain-containing protein [Clostridiales bacterium]|nr:nucleotidyltransferase domain-containing protein [Clostridiales bacterium]
MYGLLDKDIDYIVNAFNKFSQIEKVIIFGSRAMGNYKKGSDIDLAVVGKGITNNTLYDLNDYLNEVCPLPYFFDILNYNDISNENLKKHIDDVGKIIYERGN